VYSKGKEIWLKDALSRDESSKAHSKEKTDRAQRRRWGLKNALKRKRDRICKEKDDVYGKKKRCFEIV